MIGLFFVVVFFFFFFERAVSIYLLFLSQENYRTAIQTEGMIKDLVKNLSSDNDELQMHCANAIFKVATEISFFYFKRKSHE